MSAVLEHLHTLLDEAKAEFAKLFGHADADVQAAAKAAAEKIDAAKSVVETDIPVLEHEAVTDAEHVVGTAETEGVKPAEAEAVADGAHLAGEAVHDVETAVHDVPAPAAQAPATPAAPAPAASDTPAAPSTGA